MLEQVPNFIVNIYYITFILPYQVIVTIRAYLLGGGDTGCDCIATSLRQGAKSVTTFEILPPPSTSRTKNNPWPQTARVFKVDYGHEEVKTKFGKDPRLYNMLSKVSVLQAIPSSSFRLIVDD